MAKFICPVQLEKGKPCGHVMELDPHEVQFNNVFACEKCGAEFMIKSTKPFRYEQMDADDE